MSQISQPQSSSDISCRLKWNSISEPSFSTDTVRRCYIRLLDLGTSELDVIGKYAHARFDKGFIANAEILIDADGVRIPITKELADSIAISDRLENNAILVAPKRNSHFYSSKILGSGKLSMARVAEYLINLNKNFSNLRRDENNYICVDWSYAHDGSFVRSQELKFDDKDYCWANFVDNSNTEAYSRMVVLKGPLVTDMTSQDLISFEQVFGKFLKGKGVAIHRRIKTAKEGHTSREAILLAELDSESSVKELLTQHSFAFTLGSDTATAVEGVLDRTGKRYEYSITPYFRKQNTVAITGNHKGFTRPHDRALQVAGHMVDLTNQIRSSVTETNTKLATVINTLHGLDNRSKEQGAMLLAMMDIISRGNQDERTRKVPKNASRASPSTPTQALSVFSQAITN